MLRDRLAESLRGLGLASLCGVAFAVAMALLLEIVRAGYGVALGLSFVTAVAIVALRLAVLTIRDVNALRNRLDAIEKHPWVGSNQRKDALK